MYSVRLTIFLNQPHQAKSDENWLDTDILVLIHLNNKTAVI